MKTVVVIPARLESSRLPEKLLLKLGEKTIIQHVYERCLLADGINEVFIAVDHKKLEAHCKKFTENVILTDKNHQSGTDRIAEAIKTINCDAVINVQGDEPFIDPNLITSIAKALKKHEMVSAMCSLNDKDEIANPNNVKVITDNSNHAIYFSRSVIPYNRDNISLEGNIYHKHIGIYGYSKGVLKLFSKLKPSLLEKIEKLEQLRALENGFQIYMVLTNHKVIGIDTEKDYQNALNLFQSK